MRAQLDTANKRGPKISTIAYLHNLRVINLVLQVLQQRVVEARLLVYVNAVNYFTISAL